MNFDQLLKELKDEYIASIPQKITDIKAHFEANNREQLRDDFHKLKGTGKTYGLAEVSVLGELVEKLCLKNDLQVTAFIPLSLNLLDEIHNSRKSNQPFGIEDSEKFMQIKKLL